MSVLVAGGSRGVGMIACQRLAQLGEGVRALSRNGGPRLSGVDSLLGDLLEPSDCARAVDSCSAIVCTAGDYSISEDKDIVDGRGIVQLVDAAMDFGVRRFVLVSSLGVGDSWDRIPAPVRWFFKATDSVPILKAKAESEEFLKQSGLDWTILRPGYLTNHRMRARPFCREGLVPGVTTRQAVADVAVRCLDSSAAKGRTLAVCNRWLGWPLKAEVKLEVSWTPW